MSLRVCRVIFSKGGSNVIQEPVLDLYWVMDRGGNGANDD